MSDDEMKARLGEVFSVHQCWVSIARVDGCVEATIGCDGSDGRPFTFAQMMQLPEIFGTEHLDFRSETGKSQGSSWTGSYDHFNNLVITARPSATR